MSVSAVQNSFPAARLRACHLWPYTSTALLSLVPVEKPGLGTFAVDAYWRLYYDPAKLQEWSVIETSGVLLHEVCHVIRNHSRRFANVLGYDPDVVLQSPTCDPTTRAQIHSLAFIWNVAADCEINDDLDEQKIPLPNGCVLPEQFDLPRGLLAEEYFARIRSQCKPGQNGSLCLPEHQNSGGNGQGKNQSQQRGKGKGQGKPQQQNGAGYGDGESDGGLQPGIPGSQPSGSGADGICRKWEDGKPDATKQGQADGISEQQADLIRHEVARRVQNSSKSKGSVPAGFRRWADRLLEPKIDYRRELQNAVKQAIELIRGHSDYSYARLARKQPQGRLVFPATVCPNVSVNVIIDTSGSMSDEALAEAASEVSGILKALPRQDGVRVFAADAAVHVAKKCFRAEQIELYGGGGTDMDLAIVTASTTKPRPQLVICLTDGYTGWPSEPTNGVPCLAVIVSDGSESAPEWIRQIKIPPSALAKD